MRLRSCDEHEPAIDNYVTSIEDGEARLARGERQRVCDECKRWGWPRVDARLVKSEREEA